MSPIPVPGGSGAPGQANLGPVIARGRIAAESLMTLSLEAFSTDAVEVDGMLVETPVSEGTTVGKVQAGRATANDAVTRMVTVGGVARPVMQGGLHIPISAPVPVAGEQGQGWQYEVTAVGPHDDPALLGRRFLVVSVPVKSKATARRLDVVEVS